MLRVRTVFTGAGGPHLNTMYFLPAADDIAAAVAAVGDVSAFWGATDAFMNSSVTWATEPDVPSINPATGAITDIFAVNSATGVGGSAVESIPRVAQGLVRWFTNDVVNGRLVRGRTFVPNVAEASNGPGGVPIQSFIDGVDTAADTLATANFLCIWHRPTIDPGPPPVPNNDGSAHLVTSASVWNQWAFLTSRRT